MRQSQVLKSSIWNLLGYVLPMFAGLYAFPRLIRGMGASRFGLLTIVLAIIGYFSFLDFGIGRAITFSVSRALGRGEAKRVHNIYWTGSLALLVFGIGLGILVGILCPYIMLRFMKVPSDLQNEFITTVKWLGFSLPVLTLTSGPRGVLESYNKFFELTLLKTPLGILMFLMPLWIPSRLQNLAWVTAEMVALRLIWLILHFIMVQAVCRIPKGDTRFSMTELRELIGFGGWITLTNFLAPIGNIVDRFFIGSIISVSVIMYYATPFDLISRVSIIPSALAAVLFPALGKQLVDDPEAAKNLYLKSKNALWVVLFVGLLLVACFGDRFMGIWVGKMFEEKSKFIIIFLSAGLFINGMAYLPFTIIQSAGLPKRVAILHTIEISIFIPMLILFIKAWGITGASVAWFTRAFLDYCILEFMANRKIYARQFKQTWVRIVLSLLFLFGLASVHSLGLKAGVLLVFFAALGSYLVQNPDFWKTRTPQLS